LQSVSTAALQEVSFIGLILTVGFELPETVDKNQVEAKVEHGILHVTLKKVGKKEEARQIKVE